MEAQKGLEMRRMSLESMGESAKGKSSDERKRKEKRTRRMGGDTIELLKEKMKVDLEWREKEYEMKKCELEEKARKRESEERKRGEDRMSNSRRTSENSWKIFSSNSNSQINC